MWAETDSLHSCLQNTAPPTVCSQCYCGLLPLPQHRNHLFGRLGYFVAVSCLFNFFTSLFFLLNIDYNIFSSVFLQGLLAPDHRRLIHFHGTLTRGSWSHKSRRIYYKRLYNKEQSLLSASPVLQAKFFLPKWPTCQRLPDPHTSSECYRRPPPRDFCFLLRWKCFSLEAFNPFFFGTILYVFSNG